MENKPELIFERMNIDLDNILGRKELKTYLVFEDGKMVAYCYSIDYDRDGNEVGRTEPEPLSSIGWSDGSPFTQADYNNISED